MNSLEKFMENNQVLKINNCPFCKKDKVKFVWTSFRAHGRVECFNTKDRCFALGPHEEFKKYDNEKRLMNRAIKKWNKAS